MDKKKKWNSRFAAVFAFMLVYLILAFLVRLALLIWSGSKSGIAFGGILGLFGKGLVFDIGTAIFLSVPGLLYFLFFPKKYIGNKLDKGLVYTGLFLVFFIVFFSTFAEFTFWGEFESRFNFIAVDYLVYTYEVVQNINQSYPLPLLLGGMLACSLLGVFMIKKTGAFKCTFHSDNRFKSRAATALPFFLIALLYIAFLPNRWAESSENRYEQELSKNGIYSFFAAYRSNELSYADFYVREEKGKALARVRTSLREPNIQFLDSNSLWRHITENGQEQKPNVILVTIESFSADFMQHFGNTTHITPVLDSLADRSLLFTNLYATGTRTVRGMEALTLSVPPTPGNSIVRRVDNAGLFNIGTIFQSKAYSRTFFYGGDGYFDNMNSFFSGNGFDIEDRGKKLSFGDNIKTEHILIPNEDVHFKNAWGICDEDLYDAVLQNADRLAGCRKPFFDFVMTTSNHRPYTYPAGKIDIASGSGRDGAVKYTDYAIGEFLRKASVKPWFKNTVFVFVADHCASSAGKDEVEVSKYHIPCIIYNLNGNTAKRIPKLCSQIDIFPTLFHLLNWNYDSRLFGQNVLSPTFHERALPASYQVLGYMVKEKMVLLSPVRKVEDYKWSASGKEQAVKNNFPDLLSVATGYYQTAYMLYKNGKMKIFPHQ